MRNVKIVLSLAGSVMCKPLLYRVVMLSCRTAPMMMMVMRLGVMHNILIVMILVQGRPIVVKYTMKFLNIISFKALRCVIFDDIAILLMISII